MAITETALTSSSKNDGGGSFTTAATASVSPGANQLVLVDVFHNAGTAANAAVPTGVAGAGLTFNIVDQVVDTAAGSTLSRWRALSASPSTGAITITFPNATTAAVWSVHQYAGVDTTGTNGANAIVQTVHNSNGAGTVATIAATLAAFGSVNNGASGCNGWFNAGAVQTATPRAGWTEIHDLGTTYSGATLADCLETQWRATNDTTAQATWTANGAVYAIASELKFSPDVTVGLTGKSATFAAGTPAPSTARALTGSAITSAAGTVAPGLSRTLTGIGLTSATGTLVPGLSFALLGQSGTFTSGLLVPSNAAPLTGQSATFTAGTITASTGGDLTLALTGQAASFAAGTLIPATSVALNGQALTANPGTLSPVSTLALTGAGLTSTAGTLTPALSAALLGQQAAFTAGNMAVPGDVTVSLTGQVATFTAGQMTASQPSADVGAGRRRIREIYRITIDGQIFECHSLAEALKLLAAAKSLAQQIAADKAQSALALRRPATPAAMALPQITVSSRELRAAVTETKREIAQVYRQALIDAEIAMLFELDDRARHNDDALMLLM